MIAIKKSIVKKAVNFGLEKDKAEALAIEACSGMPWASRKFTKFLVDNAGEAIWEKDDLFHPLDFLLPKRTELERTVQAIYRARSGSTHEGRAYPGTASVGFGPNFPRNFFSDLKHLSLELKSRLLFGLNDWCISQLQIFIGSFGKTI